MPPVISPASSAVSVTFSERSSSLWVLLGGALTGLLLVAHQLQLQPDLSQQLARQQPTQAIVAPAIVRVAQRTPTPPISTASVATWSVLTL